jgi:hypothetical protein
VSDWQNSGDHHPGLVVQYAQSVDFTLEREAAMKRVLAIILTWLLLLSLAAPAWASKKSKRPPDNAPKEVQVKSYTKKNGKTVRAYKRRAPKS